VLSDGITFPCTVTVTVTVPPFWATFTLTALVVTPNALATAVATTVWIVLTSEVLTVEAVDTWTVTTTLVRTQTP